MNHQLHEKLDKLFTEVDHLDRAISSDVLTLDQTAIALSIAKRVRRESTMVVRHLAELRDQP